MRRPPLVAAVVLGILASCSSGSTTTNTAPATVTMFVASGDQQSALVSTPLPQPLTVSVDAASRAAAYGKTVTWTVVTGGGHLSSSTSTFDFTGLAAIFFTLGPAFGAQTVTASTEGGGTVTFTAMGTGNAYAVTPVSGNLQSASVLSPVSQPLVAVVKDSNGVVAPGRTVTWVATTGLGSVTPTTSTSDADGRATAQFTLGPLTGTQSVRASVSNSSLPATFTATGIGTTGVPQLVGVVPMPTGAGFHHDTFVRDGLAFVCAWDAGIRIYDVGNGIKGGSPSNPQLLSSLVTRTDGVSGGAQAHNAWWFKNPVTGQNTYLFVGQEGPAAVGSSSSGDIHIIDVSNLFAPVEVGFITIAGAGTHNFWMDEANQVLYAAYYNAGVIKVDVSGTLAGDMSNRILARVAPGGPGNTFTWGVMLSGNTLYATDMLSGFWALDPVTLAVKGGGNNVPERYGSDQWVFGSVAYSGTWSTRTVGGRGNIVKIWSLGVNGVPTLADSLALPGVGNLTVGTISDLAVTPDGKALVVTAEGGSGNGLYVFDRVNPLKPQLQGSVIVSQGLHTGEIAVINGRTYVFTAQDPGSPPTPQMRIYDITGIVP